MVKENISERIEPVFKKVIEKRSVTDDLQQVTTITLNPWSMTNDRTGKVSSGHSLQINTLKIGFGDQKTKRGFVAFDPSNKEIRNALNDALEYFDNLQEQED